MCEYDALRSSPENKVAMASRDAFLAANELVKLRNDPVTRDLVAKEEVELWSIKNAIELVLSSIRVEADSRRSVA